MPLIQQAVYFLIWLTVDGLLLTRIAAVASQCLAVPAPRSILRWKSLWAHHGLGLAGVQIEFV